MEEDLTTGHQRHQRGGRLLAVSAAILGGAAVLIATYNRESTHINVGTVSIPPEVPGVVWEALGAGALMLAVICLVRHFARGRGGATWAAVLAAVTITGTAIGLAAEQPRVQHASLTAYSPSDGTRLWHTSVPFVDGLHIAVGGRTVTVQGIYPYRCSASRWGYVILDRATGRQLVEGTDNLGTRTVVSASDLGAPMKVPRGYRIAGATLYATDPATGKSRWEAQLGGWPGVNAIPYVGTDTIAVPVESSESPEFPYGSFDAIGVYDAATGRRLWRTAAEGTPLYSADGSVIADVNVAAPLVEPMPPGTIVAWNSRTGARLWSANERMVAPLGDTLIVFGDRGIVTGRDVKTGTVRWKAQSEEVGGFRFTLSRIGDLLIQSPTGTSGGLYAFASNGLRWSIRDGGVLANEDRRDDLIIASRNGTSGYTCRSTD